MSTTLQNVRPHLISLIFLVSACAAPQVIESSPDPTPVSTTSAPSPPAESPTFTASPVHVNLLQPATVAAEPTYTPQPSPESQPTVFYSEECSHVSDAAFDEVVLKSPIPVIVDFWAPWCGPCKVLAPLLEQFAEEYAGKLLVARVNTDENPEWPMKFGVQGIPTLLFFSNGEVVHRQVGALPESVLRDVVEKFLENISQPTPGQ